MARRPREHPLLVSDVVRSWIAIVAAMPLLIVIPFAAVRLGVSREDLVEIAYAAIFGSWIAFGLIYIVLSLVAFLRADPIRLGQWMRSSPPPDGILARFWWGLNGGGAIYWALSGGGVSLVALVVLITSGARITAPIAIVGVFVLTSSWVLIAVCYAVNYARLDAIGGGLRFPGEERPRFADYLYLGFQISTTFGGSDVQVTRTRMRRVVATHSVIAFVYNTVIVALLVSAIISSLG